MNFNKCSFYTWHTKLILLGWWYVSDMFIIIWWSSADSLHKMFITFNEKESFIEWNMVQVAWTEKLDLLNKWKKKNRLQFHYRDKLYMLDFDWLIENVCISEGMMLGQLKDSKSGVL